MKRLMAIVILASAALAVGACNNGSGSSNGGGGMSAAPTMETSAEPTMSLESPLASDMPSVDASTAP